MSKPYIVYNNLTKEREEYLTRAEAEEQVFELGAGNAEWESVICFDWYHHEMEKDRWNVEPQDDVFGQFGTFVLVDYACAETTAHDYNLASTISMVPQMARLLQRWASATDNQEHQQIQEATIALLRELRLS